MSYIIPNISDGADHTKPRQKRCGHSDLSDTTTTARNRNWDFEHPPKEGDPADPIHKDNRLLPQKRDIKNERGRGQALFKEVLGTLLNIVRNTPSPGSLIFRNKRSADENDNKSKSNGEEAASLQ